MGLKVSVDAGYGFTKVIASNGVPAIFPSLVGYGKERLNLFGEDMNHRDLNNMQVLIRDGDKEYDYFIGDLAKRESESATYILSTDRVADHRAAALVITATAIVMKDYEGPIEHLNVGLPLQYYASHRELLKQQLENTDVEVEFKSGGFGKKRVRFEKVSVHPQGAGALWAQIWNEHGELRDPSMTGLVGLIDIGFKTTDFLVIDLGGEMQLRSELSGTVEQGMRQVLENTQRYFEQQVGTSVDPNEFEKSLERNQYKIRYQQTIGGRPVKREYDLGPVYRSFTEQLARTVQERVRQKWGSRMNFFDVVFLAGGGALALKPYFENFEVQTEICDQAQMANAIGFLMMGDEIGD